MVRIEIVFVLLALCTGLKSDNKLCSNSLELIPFSGYKVHLQYVWDIYDMLVAKQLRFSHCHHGNPLSSTVVPLNDTKSIWNSTFCLPAPQTLLQSLLGSWSTSFDSLIGWTKPRRKDRLSPPELGQDKTSTTEKKHLLERASSRLQCFKMARRKKYARSKLDIFVPHSFVGGLYACGITTGRNDMNQFQPTDILRPIDMYCDELLSFPLAPLIADFNTKQWFRFLKSVLNPIITQSVPFLKTASRFHLLSSSRETPRGQWSTQLKVNEDYMYSPLDVTTITDAIQYTSKIIRNFSLQPSFEVIKAFLDAEDLSLIHEMYLRLDTSTKAVLDVQKLEVITTKISEIWNTIDI